jgi:hypothetical protein
MVTTVEFMSDVNFFVENGLVNVVVGMVVVVVVGRVVVVKAVEVALSPVTFD